VHKVVAVGSRTHDKAMDFVRTVLGDDRDIVAYGSYEELYADEVGLDWLLVQMWTPPHLTVLTESGSSLYQSGIVASINPMPAYAQVTSRHLGTPHTSHYTNALAALKARKHVLCEKPVTCNAAELRVLINTAAENDVFFMEAMWTRFQPLALEVKRLAESGILGAPVVLHADLSNDFKIASKSLFSLVLH
jgi:hypothetical protein